MMSSRRSEQIITVDALRFLCALAVTAQHFCTVFPLATSSPVLLFGGTAPLPTSLAPWTASGWVGVELFFVISGYVIALSAERADRRGFARSRLLRLLPTGLICASLTAATLVLTGAMLPADVARRWAMTITMLPFGPRIDTVWWTLQVEVCFYLLVAFAIRADRDNGGRLEQIAVALTVWSLAFFAVSLARGHIPDSGSPAMFALMPHGMLFALGITLRAAAIHGWNRRRALVSVAAAAIALLEIGNRARDFAIASGITQPIVVPMALFVAGVLVLAVAPRWRVRPPAARAIGRVAALTYPLYLLNQVVGGAFVAGFLAIGCPGAAALVLGAIAIVILASAIEWLAQPPLRHILATLLDGLSSRRDPRPDTHRIAFPPAG